jgi:lipoic acid synthetase
MGLRYVVITSVDRDDMSDGGAAHFAACIHAIRALEQDIHIEILVPDFRNKLNAALEPLVAQAPDVFNHNMETVPELYPKVRPGARYQNSLSLLLRYKERMPNVPTKSGIMLGLGERPNQVLEVLHDLRRHRVDVLTLGQYLQPGPHHLPVQRYLPPEEFDLLRQQALEMGFTKVASGPLVRSSYHAEEQIRGDTVK